MKRLHIKPKNMYVLLLILIIGVIWKLNEHAFSSFSMVVQNGFFSSFKEPCPLLLLFYIMRYEFVTSVCMHVMYSVYVCCGYSY